MRRTEISCIINNLARSDAPLSLAFSLTWVYIPFLDIPMSYLTPPSPSTPCVLPHFILVHGTFSTRAPSGPLLRYNSSVLALLSLPPSALFFRQTTRAPHDLVWFMLYITRDFHVVHLFYSSKGPMALYWCFLPCEPIRLASLHHNCFR